MSNLPTAPALAKSLASHIKGKTILVFGITRNSLGADFLKYIAPYEPSRILLGARSIEKAKETASDLAPIPTEIIEIDMMSFASVRTAAEHINAQKDLSIDVMVNNAGSMAAPYKKSEDGYESQLQTNHLGFFLFTNLVMPKLLESKTRIVNVSSEGYIAGRLRYGDYNFHDGDVYNPWAAYGQAKTAQILFAGALARRYGDRGLVAFSVQPGHTQGTNLHTSWGPYTIQDMVKHLQMVGEPFAWQAPPPPKSKEENIANIVKCAFDPALLESNGAYVREQAVVDPDTMRPWAVDERQQRLCWQLSEQLVGQEFK